MTFVFTCYKLLNVEISFFSENSKHFCNSENHSHPYCHQNKKTIDEAYVTLTIMLTKIYSCNVQKLQKKKGSITYNNNSSFSNGR